ncbi:MAG: hypothetical protein E7665_00315 [Ruminococcaceae bacterium]|nr:hypothetical protein [Oscillospiraceae bacterium]
MNNYKIALKPESTNKYEKAKQDLIEALKSFNELSYEQQWNLINDVFGAKAVETFYQVMQKIG